MIVLDHCRLCLAVLGLLLAAPVWAAPETLPLADQGKALQPIVISNQASKETKLVADELADYLGRITGAKFEVQTRATARAASCSARSPSSPMPTLVESRWPFAIAIDGKEAFAIRTEAKRLLLIGATDLGAVARRVPLPGNARLPLVLPRAGMGGRAVDAEDLTVSLERDRSAAHPGAPHLVRLRLLRDKGIRRGVHAKDYEAWARHNRMDGSFTRPMPATPGRPSSPTTRRRSPSIPNTWRWSRASGKGEQLCVSNPDVRKSGHRHGRSEYLEKNPDRRHGVDGVLRRRRPVRVRGVQEARQRLRPRLRPGQRGRPRRWRKKYPGKMVGCWPTANTASRPSFALEPNVYVQLTAGFTSAAIHTTSCSNCGRRFARTTAAIFVLALGASTSCPAVMAPNLTALPAMMLR